MKPNPVIQILDYFAIRVMLLQKFPFPADFFKAAQERVGITILKFNVRVGAGTLGNGYSLKNDQLNSHWQKISIRSLVLDR